MKGIKFVFCFSMISLLCACAGPRYSGAAIPNDLVNHGPEVVIVEDAETRDGFLNTIKSWLAKNNYTYKVESDGSRHDLEKITIEYVGVWRWDLALFLSEAKIEAFHEGQRIAQVDYQAPNNLNTNKWSNAEERIGYMMDVLFGKISAAEATSAIAAKSSE